MPRSLPPAAILSTTGGRYIGQSKNILLRIKQHFSPRGTLNGLDEIGRKYYSMPGSTRLQREVYEQYLIDKAGIRNLRNVRNPMGGRMVLYEGMYRDVIKQFGLPW